MTTYTGTADASGNFTINIGSALTSGEIVQVTAQKDGQSKSINIQAPSEPYLPPSGGGDNELTFPMHQDYASAILNNQMVLHDGKGATVEVVGTTYTLTNQYFQPDEMIRVYQAFPIELSYFKSLSDTDDVVKLRQGSLSQNGDISWNSNGFWYKKSEILEYLESLYRFTLDNKYIYLILWNAIYFDSSVGFDMNGNYIYEITYRDVVYTIKSNKQYINTQV